MKIAVDKKSIGAVKNDGNEYIYLFDNEPLKDLLKLNMHCINYKCCNYVDVNLTEYNIDCFKKTTKEDKNYNKLPKKHDYSFAIIVPNCNNDHGIYEGKTYLKKCIESILNQKYKNFKLIIVDDMSTDTSLETIKSYNDDRLILIQNIRKRYNGGSRNVGIEYALTNLEFDYFCFLDSDDWWKHDMVLENINKKLYNHQLLTIGAEMVFTGHIGQVNYNRPECYKDLYSLNGKVWCTAWARVIRKDKIVYFCESTLMEDRVWTYRLADNIEFENVTNLKEVCYCWNRMNTTNSVSTVRGSFWDACAWCHIGHQIQLINQMKHKEMIPYIKERIDECIRRANNGQYQQY